MAPQMLQALQQPRRAPAPTAAAAAAGTSKAPVGNSTRPPASVGAAVAAAARKVAQPGLPLRKAPPAIKSFVSPALLLRHASALAPSSGNSPPAGSADERSEADKAAPPPGMDLSMVLTKAQRKNLKKRQKKAPSCGAVDASSDGGSAAEVASASALSAGQGGDGGADWGGEAKAAGEAAAEAEAKAAHSHDAVAALMGGGAFVVDINRYNQLLGYAIDEGDGSEAEEEGTEAEGEEYDEDDDDGGEGYYEGSGYEGEQWLQAGLPSGLAAELAAEAAAYEAADEAAAAEAAAAEAEVAEAAAAEAAAAEAAAAKAVAAAPTQLTALQQAYGYGYSHTPNLSVHLPMPTHVPAAAPVAPTTPLWSVPAPAAGAQEWAFHGYGAAVAPPQQQAPLVHAQHYQPWVHPVPPATGAHALPPHLALAARARPHKPAAAAAGGPALSPASVLPPAYSWLPQPAATFSQQALSATPLPGAACAQEEEEDDDDDLNVVLGYLGVST